MSWFKIRPTAPKSAPKLEVAVEETLQCEHFQVAKIVQHGFPYQPTALAFDPVQNLLAIGTKSGSIRIIGRPGVDCHVKHDADVAVTQIMFLINEGALVSVCADNQLYLWSLRQKKPEIIHALKFQRERITYCHLPFQSKWLYIGTERGNVHVLNLESFVLSGYVINWNKAMELFRKTHPGPVVHMSDNQSDPNKLLIGYESGLLTLWDLKTKTAEIHYNCTEALKSVSWHHEGKQFICSHGDGSLTTWNVRSPQQPASTIVPHGKLGRDGRPEPSKSIDKVELCTNRNSDPFTIFTGGMPVNTLGQTPTLTVMHGSNTTVLEMEYQIVDFFTVCATPWNHDYQDPYAVIILLQNDLVVIDLTSPNYPCFENPYPMDIHESPVTACLYIANCPSDLMPAFYSVGYRQKKTGFSDKEWPIKGGEWPTVATSYEEIIVTGHADGSLKFWNAPAVSLQVLYKLKTAKMFDESRSTGVDSGDSPFAIQIIRLCVESRILCVVGFSHVTLFRYSKQESTVECAAVEITLNCDLYDGLESPDVDFSSIPSAGSGAQNLPTCVKLKTGPRKWSPGYQPDLCCMLTWVDGEPPSTITSVAMNTRYGLLAFGNEAGLAIVDAVQKTCLISIGTPDLYGSMDPQWRGPRSPKLKSLSRPQGIDGLSHCMTSDDVKSPVVEQSGPTLSSPSTPKQPQSLCSDVDVGSGDNVVNKLSDLDDSSVGSGSSHRPLEPGMEQAEVDEVTRAFTDEHSCSRGSKDIVIEVTEAREYIGAKRLSAVCQNDISQVPTPVKPPRRPRRHSGAAGGGGGGGRKDLSKLHLDLPPPPTFGTVECEVDGGETPGSDQNYDECSNSYPFIKGSQRPMRSSWSATPTNTTPDANAVPMTAPVCSSKGDGLRFVTKMNQKLKNYMKSASSWRSDKELPVEPEIHEVGNPPVVNRQKSHEIEVVDLTSDDLHSLPYVHKMTFAEFSLLDRTDAFCRSQSSSMSSLENVNKEAIQCLMFGEVFARKSDSCTYPCLWVGTSFGSILVISIMLPPDSSARKSEHLSASPTGTVFRMKGAIMALAFLDSNGIPIQTGSEPWRDQNREDLAKDRRPYTRQQSASSLKVQTSSSSPGTEVTNDQQFAVMCSEKQARVVALPSQTCIYKVKVTETSSIVKADVVSMRDGACLACFLLNGRVSTFSLPSLKPLLDVECVSIPDVRTARTLCFSCNCNVLYFCSPTELQKVTLSAEMCENLTDMLGELFVPCDMPEPPKQGFFKNLFSVGSSTLDREELFGERSGKAARGVAKYTSGIAQTQDTANLACSEIGRAKMAAIERGEKLGELEEKTTQMMLDAEVFSQRANQIKNKYKDKKWYQF